MQYGNVEPLIQQTRDTTTGGGNTAEKSKTAGASWRGFLASNTWRPRQESHVEVTLQEQVHRSSAANPGSAHVRGICKVATEFKNSYAAKGKIRSGRIFSLFNSCFPYVQRLVCRERQERCSSWEYLFGFYMCQLAAKVGGRQLAVFRPAGWSGPSNECIKQLGHWMVHVDIDSVLGRRTWHHTAFVQTAGATRELLSYHTATWKVNPDVCQSANLIRSTKLREASYIYYTHASYVYFVYLL
jgi:hypothetical protein